MRSPRAAIARLGVAALVFVLTTARADDFEPVAETLHEAARVELDVSAARGARIVTAPPPTRPMVAIIIDDLGYRLAEGLRAARLPGPVAVAILPHTPHASLLAREADALGKEIVLHVPMQSVDLGEALGPGALELDQTRAEVVRTLADDLAAVPLARAVSDHMGSSLTREPEPMSWIMEELKARGPLPFIESYTTADSVALGAARAAGVPALGIGHPHEVTLALLERMLPTAAAEGVQIVRLAELLAARGAAEREGQ